MYFAASILMALLASQSGQKPEWCRALPRPEYRKLERVNVPDKWFEVYRIRPGLFAIYEPHQQEEIISYLIVGEKQALLFDTGMGISNIKKVVEGLTQLPVSVMNSHTHNDHVSGNWQFRRIYGMDTAFTREHAKGSVAAAQEEISPDAICGDLPAGFDAKSYAVKPFHITHWIHGGEKIDLGGRVLEVISTPGHTPDSISLWDAHNRLLFTGDMYYPGPIFLFRPETDLNAYEASIKKMISMGATQLLTAHNIAIGDPADLPRVLAAMQQVRSGKIKPVKAEHWSEYKFEGFSFLLSK
jgi:glyoxylase-like metal-dependent hydrolase (beta-lactamase superfamily II)